MQKAYDLKALGEKVLAMAEAEGLSIAEEAVEALAKAAYLGVKAWAQESAQLSENKIDDFFVPFYENLDAFVLDQIKKIDLDGSGQ